MHAETGALPRSSGIMPLAVPVLNGMLLTRRSGASAATALECAEVLQLLQFGLYFAFVQARSERALLAQYSQCFRCMNSTYMYMRSMCQRHVRIKYITWACKIC